MTGRREVLLGGVHLWGLCGLVVAQPLFDLVSTNAAFLVARRAGAVDVFALIGLLCFALPCAFLVLELLALAVSRRCQRWLHLLHIAGLCSIAALLSLRAVVPEALWNESGVVAIGLAALAGVTVALCYAAYLPVRSFFTVLSPAALLFPLLFLLNADISALVFPSSPKASALRPVSQTEGQRDGRAAADVIFIVLDELPLVSLLEADGGIDAGRYPGFARLAADSTWFRNTSTVSESTMIAVPAILSGTDPKADALPTFDDYPDSIFTRLQSSHAAHVLESHTMLCPETICEPERQPFRRRFAALAQDLLVVYFHLLLPGDLASSLPPIHQTWKDFGRDDARADSRSDHPPGEEEVLAKARSFYPDRAGTFRRFVGQIRDSDAPTLHVIHTLLPHVPWKYFPSGVIYAPPGVAIPGLLPEGEVWRTNEALIAQGQQRHLLQVELVDRLIALLIARLEEQAIYDSSVVAVVADHGASFWPERHRRAPRGPYVSDILRVPFFIKTPFQTRGEVRDNPVRVSEIVPAIEAVLTPRPAICLMDRVVPIRSRALAGQIDGAELVGQELVLHGWAADLERGEPAVELLVFEGGQLLHAGPTNAKRPDVARRYAQPSLLEAGFQCRVAGRSEDLSDYRVFALSEDGNATELSAAQARPPVGPNGPLDPAQSAPRATRCGDIQAPATPFIGEATGYLPDELTASSPATREADAQRSLAPLRPSLARKLAVFQPGVPGLTPLPAGGYEALIGRSVDQLAVVGASGRNVSLDLEPRFFKVGPARNFVPAHIAGRISDAESIGDTPVLAVAVNGTIQAVMPSFTDPKGTTRFSLLTSEDAFRVGSNELAFFLVTGSPDAPLVEAVEIRWPPGAS